MMRTKTKKGEEKITTTITNYDFFLFFVSQSVLYVSYIHFVSIQSFILPCNLEVDKVARNAEVKVINN